MKLDDAGFPVYEQGDLVTLRSGSAQMVVARTVPPSPDDPNSEMIVHCVLFDSSTNGLRRFDLPPLMLTPVDPVALPESAIATKIQTAEAAISASAPAVVAAPAKVGP